MAGGLLRRKAVVAVEQEAVEGTAETLVAADGTMLVYDLSFSPNIERFMRQPARAYLGKLAAVPGRRVGTVSFRTEFKGSGAVATAPAWADALLACGFQQTAVSTQSCGAISGGPFQPGETIKDTGRNATGRIVGEIENGASYLHYAPTSGAFTAEQISGITSGAGTTFTTTPSASKGFEYLPDSSTPPSATVGVYVDGLRHLLYGCRGNVRLEAGAVGEPMFLAFEFSGVYNGTTDTALLSPTYETEIPQAFLNVDPTILGYASAIIGSLSIDMGNVLAERQDAAHVRGVRSYFITDRDPVLSVDPELELVATHDFYGSLATGTTGRCYFELGNSGASAGSLLKVGMPRAQYKGLSDADRNGLAVVTAEMDLISGAVTTGDDEIQIGMV